jgi:hypothetical protein
MNIPTNSVLFEFTSSIPQSEKTHTIAVRVLSGYLSPLHWGLIFSENPAARP